MRTNDALGIQGDAKIGASEDGCLGFDGWAFVADPCFGLFLHRELGVDEIAHAENDKR